MLLECIVTETKDIEPSTSGERSSGSPTTTSPRGANKLRARGTIDRFIDATFAVPTRSEIYKYAAYDRLMRLERCAAPRTAR